jgi:uncharacterized protein (DUF58 family)
VEGRVSLATYAPVLDAARGIGWPALHRVRSAAPGPHVSTVRGTSSDFVEYRPYRQGDDPKRIDWKLVARTNRVYVRVSQERTILPTMFVVDSSASMAFPGDTRGKWELARRLAVGLAAIARHRGDPVGLAMASSAGSRVVPPRTRRTVLDEVMRALELVPAGEVPLAPTAVDAMHRAARAVLITDFLGDADALLAAGKTFAAAGGELYAIHVVDRGELDPDPKKLLLADPEHPTVRRPMSPPAREAYLRRFAEWRATLASDWRSIGAVYTMVVPDDEAMRGVLRRITTPRGMGRRLG